MLAAYRAAGIAVHGVYDRTTHEALGIDGAAERYAAVLDDLSPGGEFDGQPGTASWVLDVPTISWLIGAVGHAFRARNPAIRIVSPGLISGDPERLLGVNLTGVRALNLHLYATSALSVADKLTEYRRAYPDLELWIGECWPDAALFRNALEWGAARCADWLVDPDNNDLGIAGHQDRIDAFTALAREFGQGGDVATPLTDNDVWLALWRSVVPDAEWIPEHGLEKDWRANFQILGWPLSKSEMPYKRADGSVVQARLYSKGILRGWVDGAAVTLPLPVEYAA